MHDIHVFPLESAQLTVVGFDTFGPDSISDRNNICEFASNKQFVLVEGRLGSADLLRVVFQNYKVDTVVMLHNDNYDRRHQDTAGASVSLTQACLLGTHIIVETAKYFNISRLMYVSSDEVYGVHDSPQPTQASLPEPANPYAATMIGSEHLIKSYVRSFKFPAILTRLCNVYGPKQPSERLVSRCLSNLLEGKACTVQGDGSSTRSWLYIDDCVAGLATVLFNGSVGTTYNIVPEKAQSVLEVVHDCLNVFKLTSRTKELIEFVPDRQFKDTRYALDRTTVTELGWKQQTDFITGLRLTLVYMEAMKNAAAIAANPTNGNTNKK